MTSLAPALLNVCWVVGYAGLQILPNGVSQLTDDMGRQSGEAYVQFALASQAEEALAKHKEKMGHRWGVRGVVLGPFPPLTRTPGVRWGRKAVVVYFGWLLK